MYCQWKNTIIKCIMIIANSQRYNEREVKADEREGKAVSRSY